jgi:phosphoserine phosphatase
MEIIITMVSNPQIMPLSADVVSKATKAMQTEGGALKHQTVLADGEAVDLYFSGIDVTVAKNSLNKALNSMPVDTFCANGGDGEETRKKKMLVADMDSTILTVECIDEIADMLGIKDKVSQITEEAMRDELDFSASLIERVALLAGLQAKKLDEVYENRIHLSQGAENLVGTMVKYGASTHLLSGGFTFFSEKIALKLGFTHNSANVLEIKNGILTGKVTGPILNAEGKRAKLIEAREKLGLNAADVLAVGDGANDIPMILEAGLGVAYRAKPKTAAKAAAVINHTGLETLLFYQGFKRAEFSHI